MKGVIFIAFCGLLFPLLRQNFFIYKCFMLSDVQVLNLSFEINAYRKIGGTNHVV